MMNDADKRMQMMPKQFSVHSICSLPIPYAMDLPTEYSILSLDSCGLSNGWKLGNVIERYFIFA